VLELTAVDNKEISVKTQMAIDDAVRNAFKEELGAFANRIVSHLKDRKVIAADQDPKFWCNAIVAELENWVPWEKKETPTEVVTRAVQKILASGSS
jgi:hypothetical protein